MIQRATFHLVVALFALVLSSAVRADSPYRRDYSIFVEIWRPGDATGTRTELVTKGQRFSDLGAGWMCEYQGSAEYTAFDPRRSISVLSLRCTRGQAVVETSLSCPITRADLERELTRTGNERVMIRLNLSEVCKPGAPATGVIIGCEPSSPDPHGEGPSDSRRIAPTESAQPPSPRVGAASVPAAWIDVRSDDDRFRAQFPTAPKRSSEIHQNPSGRPPVVVHSFQAETGHAIFALQFMRMEDAHIDPSATVERVLEGTRDGMLKNTGAQLLSERRLKHQGWPALEVIASVTEENQTVRIRGRFVMVGRRSYMLMVVGATDADAARFFDALVVSAPEDDFRLPHRQTSPKRRFPASQ